MNQKNLYSVIAALLLIQGIAFFIMNAQLMASAFPDIDDTGRLALGRLLEVMAALSVLLGLVTYATRTTPNLNWAFTIGSLLLLAVTFKHKFMDGINVPIPAMIIQILMVVAFGYLWAQEQKRVVVNA